MCIPAHTCRLVKAKYRRGKIPNEYTVDSEKIIDCAAGLYIHPAVYTRDSSRVLCIDNYSHYDYVIPKNTRLGHIIHVDIASKPIKGLKPETIRVLNYSTPEANEEHWQKVKPSIIFGDESPETVEAREKLLDLCR